MERTIIYKPDPGTHITKSILVVLAAMLKDGDLLAMHDLQVNGKSYPCRLADVVAYIERCKP